LENFSTGSKALRTNGKALALILQRNFLQLLQILFDIAPGKATTRFLKTTLQFLLEYQCQETAENVSA
jgi:hypothetical protein